MMQCNVVSRSCLKLFRCVLFLPPLFIFCLTIHASASRLHQVLELGPSPGPESSLNPSPTVSSKPEPKLGPNPRSVPTPESNPGSISEPVSKPELKPSLSPRRAPTPEPNSGPTPVPTSKPEPNPSSSPMPVPTPEPNPSPSPKTPLKPEPKPGPSPSSVPSPEPNPGPIPGPSPKPEPKPRPNPQAPPKPAPPKPQNTTFPAVFAFGDSIVDTGNNDYILTLIKANFLPYGMSFPHGVPTGRFCNGKIPCDFLAEFLGVKPTLPPYLRPGLTREDLLTGVSFASGGSGYDPLTPLLVVITSDSLSLRAIPMSDQLTYFQEYIEKVKGFVGEEKAEHIISKGLAIVIAGSDDLANTYYGTHAEEFLYDIDSYTSFMASSAASFAMQLYESGARKIGFAGIPPIGCIPIQRTTRGGIKRKCADELNVAAQLFNSKLSTSLHSVAETLKNATLVYIEIYSHLAHMIQNPKDFGFDEIDRGCCGTGLIELGPLCNKFTSLLCNNVSSYMFWDSYHPTERAYRILTKKFVEIDMGPFYDK